MPNNLLENLNPEQVQAVTHQSGPMLIVAGAGTGKTSVITKRVAWLIEQNLAKPDEILVLTFGEKAAGELEERMDKLLPYGYVDLWVSTYHAFAERILKEQALEIGLPNDFKILSETGQWMLVRKNLSRFSLDYYKPFANPTKFIKALLKHFSRAKDELITPEEYLAYVENLKLNNDSAEGVIASEDKLDYEKYKEIANAYHVYNQLLLEQDAFDFGDLINYTLKLFRTRPRILEQYRKKFKYILVDEFQDTNIAQYELVKLLAAPNNNLTVCADDDQSIFRFRGASISNVLQFKNDYPSAREVFLTINYRSRQNILDLSYKLIQNNNPYRLEVQLQTAGQQLSKKLIANKAGSGTIEHLHFNRHIEEARGVAKKIIALKEAHPELAWNDFAILARANDTAMVFLRELEHQGVSAEFLSSRGLYLKPEITDVLSYLKMLDNYHESPSLYRVLAMPIFGLTGTELIHLNYLAGKNTQSLYKVIAGWPTLDVPEEVKKKIKIVLDFIHRHSELAKRSRPKSVILQILDDIGYLKYLANQGEEKTAKSVGYLNQLMHRVESFEDQYPDSRTADFVREIGYEQEAGDTGALPFDPASGPDAVKILTVHAAKGLEFTYVFVVDLVQLRFPSTDKKDPIPLPLGLIKEVLPEGDVHLQEERRLFYVAMTRAKDGLYLTSAADHGGARKKKISRFLTELEFTDAALITNGYPSEALVAPTPVVEAIKEKFTLPEKFSFTQLKAFENCPLQYKFAHILRIPLEDEKNRNYGKTIHKVLQQFLAMYNERRGQEQTALLVPIKIKTLGGLVSKDELLKLFLTAWSPVWYESESDKDKKYVEARRTLGDFYDILKEAAPNPVYLEQSFNLKVGEYTVRGNIDRVDKLPDGTIEIIDYKTGKAKTAKKLKKDDTEQLYIYKLAAEEVLKEKVSRLSFYYLENNEKVSFDPNPDEAIRVKEKIYNTIKEIQASDFIATPDKNTCSHCDFRNICNFKML